MTRSGLITFLIALAMLVLLLSSLCWLAIVYGARGVLVVGREWR